MTLLRKSYEKATTVLQPLQAAHHYTVTTVTTASKVYTRVPLKIQCLQTVFIIHVINTDSLGRTFRGVNNVKNSEYINTEFKSKWHDIGG